MKPYAIAFIAMLATGAAHAQSALTLRAAELQAQAQADAATLAMLPEKTKVEVLRRSGAWNEVKTANGQTGWVRMFSLRLEASSAPAAQASGNSIKALTGLLSSGRSTNTGTVTTGVRGLTAEDLKNARANPAELQKMQTFAADKAAAHSYAQRTRLSSVKVEYLSQPAPATPAQTDEPGAGVGMGGG